MEDTAAWRKSGSCAFSAGVNLLRTKSISEILPAEGSFDFTARLEPLRAALSVPKRSLGKSSVPRLLMVDLRPLLPPAEPFSRRRILPKSRLKSSQTIKMSELGTL